MVFVQPTTRTGRVATAAGFLTAMLWIAAAGSAQAQSGHRYDPQSGRRGGPSASERAARASWTPTRGGTRQTVAIPSSRRNHGSNPDASGDAGRQEFASGDVRRQQLAGGDVHRQHLAGGDVRRQHLAGGDVRRQGPATPVRIEPQAATRASTTPVPTPGGVRTVGYLRSPIRQTSTGASVMQNDPIVDGGVYHDAPIGSGGIIHHGAVVDGGLVGSACDALPGGCGCGDSVCGGGCGFEAACGCELAGCDGGCDSACGPCVGGCDAIGPGGCCSLCGELPPSGLRPTLTLALPSDGWVSFEYLAWVQDGIDVPPLVTTSTDPTVAQAQAGVLGQPSTQVLFGGDDLVDDSFDGGRLRVGLWLDSCHRFGVSGEYFRVGTETDSFSATSGGVPILARPFTNLNTGGIQDSQLVAFPGVISGTVGVTASSRLTGAAFHLRGLRSCDSGCGGGWLCGCQGRFCSRTELMVGYRHLDLRENVTITENLVTTTAPVGGRFDIIDDFRTRNQFNGLDLGWYHRRTRNHWIFDGTLRLAVGNNHQTARIAGSTSTFDPTATPTDATFAGGLLAQPSNIGEFSQDEFAVVPEIELRVGYQLTDHLRATVGYNFIYWSNVIRPGGVIDPIVNTDQLPPAITPSAAGPFPAFAFDTTDYWVQGISVGGEYRW